MTSIPASRSARAMILAPRSWPSRPGLATTTRIFRVCVLFTARGCYASATLWRRHGGARLLAGVAAGGIGRLCASSGDGAAGRRAAPAPARADRAPDGGDDRRARRRPRAPHRGLVDDRAEPARAAAPVVRRDRPERVP